MVPISWKRSPITGFISHKHHDIGNEMYRVAIGTLLGLIGAILWAEFISDVTDLGQALLIGTLCGGPLGITMGGVRPYLGWKSIYYVVPSYLVFSFAWLGFMSNQTNISLSIASLLICTAVAAIGGEVGSEVLKNGL